MKKYSLYLLCLFTLNTIFAQNISFFSFSNGNHVMDLSNGNDMERIDNQRNLNNINLVNRTVVTFIRDNEKRSYETFYNNGFENIYNEKHFLLKEGKYFSYKYISDFERERFYYGEKENNEKISFEDNCFTITTQLFSKSLKTNELHESSYKIERYYYKDKNLISYEEEDWYRKGVKSELVKKLNFYYDENNRLIKLDNGYIGDTRSITYISYDDNENIKELNVCGPDKKLYYVVKFSGYDDYDNWTKQQTFVNDKLTETVIREIFYN